MREEPGLAQHERAHRLKIVDRGLVPQRVERLPRRAVAKLRLVAEREERLRAARGRTCASDRKHFVRGKIGGPTRAWPLGEGAVMADVPAEMGERNKHLARIGKIAAMPCVAQTPCGVDQLREWRLFQPNRKRFVAQNRSFNHP